MFKRIALLSSTQVDELRAIAAAAPFVDGRISNPHNKAKNNSQLHDPAAYQRSAALMLDAFRVSEEFRDFAFPRTIAPPMLSRYKVGMHYGPHADAALLQLPQGLIRSDLSCTIFLTDPADYDGGALAVQLGDCTLRFRESAGTAIVYPSTTLHQVEPVTRGERLVALTFIQSRIADPAKRSMMYELNEVAALEGLGMAAESYTRLSVVQANLMRLFADMP